MYSYHVMTAVADERHRDMLTEAQAWRLARQATGRPTRKGRPSTGRLGILRLPAFLAARPSQAPTS